MGEGSIETGDKFLGAYVVNTYRYAKQTDNNGYKLT